MKHPSSSSPLGSGMKNALGDVVLYKCLGVIISSNFSKFIPEAMAVMGTLLEWTSWLASAWFPKAMVIPSSRAVSLLSHSWDYSLECMK